MDFKTRKAARIADQQAGVTFRFAVVVAGLMFHNEEVGSFGSRREAEAFIAQRGPWVGNCLAVHALVARHPDNYIPGFPSFRIVRIKENEQ